MVQIYLACRDNWGGWAQLPDIGGVMDQAALMMDALTEIAQTFAAFARLKKDMGR
jgi:hypothetical protein